MHFSPLLVFRVDTAATVTRFQTPGVVVAEAAVAVVCSDLENCINTLGVAAYIQTHTVNVGLVQHSIYILFLILLIVREYSACATMVR